MSIIMVQSVVLQKLTMLILLLSNILRKFTDLLTEKILLYLQDLWRPNESLKLCIHCVRVCRVLELCPG